MSKELIFLACALAGLPISYLFKTANGHVRRGLWGYLISYPARTMGAVMTIVGADLAASMSGQFAAVPMVTVAMSGLMTGWALDAGINKGEQK